MQGRINPLQYFMQNNREGLKRKCGRILIIDFGLIITYNKLGKQKVEERKVDNYGSEEILDKRLFYPIDFIS